MRVFRFTWFIALACALGLAISSCGGGGAGSPAGQNVGGSNVTMFATDDISAKYSHVWVTILKVVLTNSSGPVTAYSNATGQQIDVAALRTSGVSNVFAFLAAANVPAGDYTSATLTLAGTVTLVPTGSTTSITETFGNLDSSGDKDVTINFAPNEIVSNGTSLVFDFNLSQWTDDGHTMNCVIQNGPTTGLNNTINQVTEDSVGTVSNLSGTAPAQTFTLTRNDHFSITVTTSGTTSFSNSDGSPNPLLANGQTVDVRGTFSITANSLLATSVEIGVSSSGVLNSDVMAAGTLSGYTSGTTTFTMTLNQARHFRPAGSTVTVATTSTTKFFGFKGENLGSTEFFALLASSSYIQVEGAYDGTSNTVTADFVALQGNPRLDTNGVSLRGTAAAGGSASSLQLSITQENGLSLAAGTTITVVPSTSAVYYDTTGTSVDAATFSTDLAAAASVTAIGNYNASTTTLTASTYRLWPTSTGLNNIEVIGTTSEYLPNSSFTLMVSDWQYGPFYNGKSISVTTTSSTTYSNSSGPTTQTEFDAAEVNVPILVTGTLNADGSLTATSIAVPNHHGF